MLTWLGNVASLKYFIGELWLALACCVVLMLPLIPKFRNVRMSWITLTALVFAGICVLRLPTDGGGIFFGMLAIDGLSKFFKIFFVLSTLVVVLMTEVGREVPDFRKPEFYSILLGVLIGAFLAASATDLLMMYLAIELLSLGSYVLAGFSRIEKTSDEASMKYILYGGLSTGAMLFGMSYLYGLTGSTNLIAIREALEANQIHPLVFFVSFLLIMVGIGYKISAVPFHFWAPDVYQGAPTSITAFLSVASKGAGFAAFIRIFYTSFLTLNGEGVWSPVGQLDWRILLSILAIVTMTFGNLAAFGQNNVKRLLAYSGIAHAGYILVGAIALNQAGMQSILFYLLTYLFTNLAAFTVVLILADCNGVEEIEGYKSLGTRSPWLAFCLAVALFSLIGVPPMAGFLGKWFLFAAAVRTLDPWCVAAVVAGLLNSVLSVYYYFRIMKAMYLEKGEEVGPIRTHSTLNWVATAMTLPVLLIIFDGGSLYDWTGRLSQMLLG
ncbi:MAG: NADH-quinone oxidoreductase subunit N [Candidatus Omnitrophica bacterium]|nr:NADH-quinone oxidoreductase subunit N [Candidatus Omnitrophota bacterium]